MISIVIPVFNEEENILPLFEELKDVLDKESQEYELIFVNDGSTDDTLENLLGLIPICNQLRIIRFSHRFGKSAALTAGFSHVRGEIVVTLDGDGQDVPENIPLLLTELKEEVDVVCGWRFDRQDSFFKKLNSKIYNLLNRIFNRVQIHDNNCMLRVYRKEAVSELFLVKGAHRYVPAILTYRGFKITETKVSHRSRLNGKSKYGTKRLFKGFVDLFRFSLFLKRDYKEESNKLTLYEIEEKIGFE